MADGMIYFLFVRLKQLEHYFQMKRLGMTKILWEPKWIWLSFLNFPLPLEAQFDYPMVRFYT